MRGKGVVMVPRCSEVFRNLQGFASCLLARRPPFCRLCKSERTEMLSVNLGPLALPVGVVILMCALCAAVVAGRWMVRGGGPRGALLTSRVFDVLLVAVIAARLVFIVAYWEFYRAAPWGVLDVRDGGFSLIGGMVGAVLACAWLLWRRRMME